MRFEKRIQEAIELLFDGLELHPRRKFAIAGNGAVGGNRLFIGFLICLFPAKKRTDSIDETMPRSIRRVSNWLLLLKGIILIDLV